MLSPAHNTQLEIVDEDDHVIGTASRSEIHAHGMLHREVHVWFVTPDKKIIFQKRAADKDTFPGLLDATVGGHVELGQGYEEAALREVEEECGLSIAASDLLLIDKYRGHALDSVTGAKNNVFRAIYGYIYPGAAETLVIEADAATGFEPISVAKLTADNKELEPKLIPSLLSPYYTDLYTKLAELVSCKLAS